MATPVTPDPTATHINSADPERSALAPITPAAARRDHGRALKNSCHLCLSLSGIHRVLHSSIHRVFHSSLFMAEADQKQSATKSSFVLLAGTG